MKNKNFILFSIIIACFSVLFITSSCKKKPVGKAIITVIDSLNQPVYGAIVNLNSNNNPKPGVVKDKKTSDNNGKTYHEFPLEVILQIEVTKGSKVAPKSNIHIIPGETATQTVKLK
ncbi:MAG: hypothetical protein IT238_12495 [Bacteroidia bacterium]|nr:hypothetical protein [Bacteroidia bacterium]MCZ2249211.1 hypothetical protein [Bacteroidia bacterium]